MRFRSLESRIVSVFLVMLVMGQLAGYLVITKGISENGQAALKVELANGERMLNSILSQDTQKLRRIQR